MAEALGAGEIVEIISGGGLWLTGEKRDEAVEEEDMPAADTKCCCCNKRRFLAVVCFCYVVCCVSEVVMEGIAFHSCSTADGVEYGLGLNLWLGAYIVMSVFVVPVEMWLLPYLMYKKPSFWNRCIDQDATNPYCLCSKYADSVMANKVCNMRMAIHLFVLFEDILRMILASGKFIFAASGIEANVEAFKGTSNITALTILLAVETTAFLMRWSQMYSKLPCVSCRCSLAILWKTIVFDFVSFCASLIATSITALSFQYTSELFQPEYPVFIDDRNSSYSTTPTNLHDVTTADIPLFQDPSKALLAAISGGFTTVFFVTFCLLVRRCRRKLCSKK